MPTSFRAVCPPVIVGVMLVALSGVADAEQPSAQGHEKDEAGTVMRSANEALARRFGVGAHAALSGATGVSLRFFPSRAIGLELILRADLQNLGYSTIGPSLSAEGRGEAVLRSSPIGFLAAFIGARIAVFGAVRLAVAAGLKGEYLLWNDMSLFAETGLMARIDLGDTVDVEFRPGVDVVLGPGGSPFANVGFTFWFN